MFLRGLIARTSSGSSGAAADATSDESWGTTRGPLLLRVRSLGLLGTGAWISCSSDDEAAESDRCGISTPSTSLMLTKAGMVGGRWETTAVQNLRASVVDAKGQRRRLGRASYRAVMCLAARDLATMGAASRSGLVGMEVT